MNTQALTFALIERMKDCLNMELSKYNDESRAVLHDCVQRGFESATVFYRHYLTQMKSSPNAIDVQSLVSGMRSKFRLHRPLDADLAASYDRIVNEFENVFGDLQRAMYSSWTTKKAAYTRNSEQPTSWTTGWFDRGVDFVTLKWLF